MKKKLIVLLLALSFFLILGTGICVAQTDLSTIDRITVKVAGNEETITILQDFSKKEQWYYVPNRPRLVERRLHGKKTPVFNLIRYQFRKGSGFDEGGIMQFALSFALPEEAVRKAKTQIAAKMTNALRDEPKEKRKTYGRLDINLVALPIKSAQFFLYSPGGEEMMTSDTPTEGMAPTFASQNIPFSLSLTENGTSVFDTIVNDTLGGIPVIIRMDYTGLSAPAGFKCTVNWDVTYRRMQQDVKLAAALSGVPYVTPGIDAGYSNLRAALEKRGCIKLEVIEGSGFKLADADKYLQPVLTLMAREMLENPAAPSYLPKKVIKKKAPLVDVVKQLTTPAAQTPASAAGGMMPSVSVKLSYTMKDEKLVRKGKQTFDMNVRQALSQSTVCGGFIGIAEYPKDVRDQVVTVVPGGDWDKAYLSLPRIISDDDMGIHDITLTASLNDGKKDQDQQVATWTPEEGWTGLGDTGQDEEIRRFAFPTMALKAALKDKWQDAYFKLISNISYKPPLYTRPGSLTYKGTTRIKLFSGNAPMSSPMDMAELWVFDAGYLFFNADDPSSELKRVTIRITSDKPKLNVQVVVDPTRNDARMIPVLVDKEAKYVKATISFTTTSGGKPIQWEHNGENLKTLPDYDGGLVTLNDWEWLR